MAPRTDVRTLGNNGMGTYGNRPQAVEHHLIADPGMVADTYLPGIGERATGPQDYAFAYPGAKATQQPAPPGVYKLRRGLKQKILHQPPELNVGSRVCPES